jgi:alanine transaminase
MLSRGIIGIAFSGGAGVALRRAFTTQSLSLDTLNPNVRKMEYAVRGKILIEAMNIHEDMLKNQHKYPFEDVVYANIGDCQAMGQKPLTFVRQLLACCADASLIHSDDYPIDVRERARDILGDVSGESIGSYSDSRGIALIRKHVEEFITKRDGFKANIDNIYLVNGGTEGIRTSISLCLMEGEKAGIMIPIPQYPLYTATIAEYNAHPVI